MLLFPAFATTESGLRPHTDDAASSLGQAKRYPLASPTKDGFRPQGVALTIFQRHLGLKRAPLGAAELGCRQAQISYLRRGKRRLPLKRGVLQTHDRTSRVESGFTFLEISRARLLYHRMIFSGNRLTLYSTAPRRIAPSEAYSMAPCRQHTYTRCSMA
jgi:urease beta subunit